MRYIWSKIQTDINMPEKVRSKGWEKSKYTSSAASQQPIPKVKDSTPVKNGSAWVQNKTTSTERPQDNIATPLTPSSTL